MGSRTYYVVHTQSFSPGLTSPSAPHFRFYFCPGGAGFVYTQHRIPLKFPCVSQLFYTAILEKKLANLNVLDLKKQERLQQLFREQLEKQELVGTAVGARVDSSTLFGGR